MGHQHNRNCKVLRNRYRCPICKKGYMMEWAFQNNYRRCKEREKKD